MVAITFLLFVAGLMVYLRFGHSYVLDLLDQPTGSVQPWHSLDEQFDDEIELFVQARKPNTKPVTSIEDEPLEALPNDPLALALLKATLTEEQIKAIRLAPVGGFVGESLEELPVVADIENDHAQVEPVQVEMAFALEHAQ